MQPRAQMGPILRSKAGCPGCGFSRLPPARARKEKKTDGRRQSSDNSTKRLPKECNGWRASKGNRSRRRAACDAVRLGRAFTLRPAAQNLCASTMCCPVGGRSVAVRRARQSGRLHAGYMVRPIEPTLPYRRLPSLVRRPSVNSGAESHVRMSNPLVLRSRPHRSVCYRRPQYRGIEASAIQLPVSVVFTLRGF